MTNTHRAGPSKRTRSTLDRELGGRLIRPIGLGGVHWSLVADDAIDDASAIAVIHTALDRGVRLIDTARAYTTLSHPSHNESLIRRALNDHPHGAEVLVATKGGHYRSGARDFPIDGHPDTLRKHVADSLAHLGRESLDLYFLHHPDPTVPIETSIETLAVLRDHGLIRGIGVSNVNAELLRRARSVTRIDAVQNHLSVTDQADVPLARATAEDGIAYLAYSPLGGPTLSGSLDEAVPALRAIATAHGVSIQQVALAWALSVAPNVIAVVGSRRPASIQDSVAAADLQLTAHELAELDGPAA